MPKEEEHERPEDMVESSQEEEELSARSLEDAVDSHGTLEGYYAMNNEKPPKEVLEEIEAHRKTKPKTV